MKPTSWQRLDLLARQLTPFALALGLAVLGQVPTRIPGLSNVAPMLALMAVFHWTVFRPSLMPALAVFAVGVMQDLLSAMPIGINAVVFLTVYGVVLNQRRFFVGKTFPILWLGFIIVAAGAAAETWVLVSLWHMTLADPRALAHQYLLTVGIFPAVAWLFLRWQRILLPDEA
jgi:rod shape-determining protein MreD